MIELKFINCRVLIWPKQKCLVTIFDDGAELNATSNYDDESYARAQSLGYGYDTWAMSVGHEIAHCVLAEMDGLPYSPALWAAAHPDEPRTKEQEEQFHQEECRVLEMQRFTQLHNKILKGIL